MIVTAPRFLRLNGCLYLMSARIELGKVLDLAGPYQCISTEGVSPAEFMQAMMAVLTRASEAAPVEVSELSQELQQKLIGSVPQLSPAAAQPDPEVAEDPAPA